MSSECISTSSSALFLGVLGRRGPGGKLQQRGIHLGHARELRQVEGHTRGGRDQHHGDDPVAPSRAGAMLAFCRRADFVDARQHVGRDLFEFAHRADRRQIRFGHQRRREIVGGGAEDGGLAFGGRGFDAAIEPQSVLQHRAHLVGDMPHGRRPFAALLGQQPGDQQFEARRNRLHRLDARHRLGGDLLRVEGRIERRIAREQFVGQRAETIDVVRGARGFVRRAAADWRRTASPGGPLGVVAFGCAGAEIGQQRAARGVEQDVRRLQVTMNDTPRVRVFQRRGDVDEQRQDARVRSAAKLAEIAARRVDHGQHHRVGATHGLVDAQHARMIQAAR